MTLEITSKDFRTLDWNSISVSKILVEKLVKPIKLLGTDISHPKILTGIKTRNDCFDQIR